MDREGWQAIVHRVAQSQTLLKRFSRHPCIRLREDNGTSLQYSCLENPMDRGAWWAALYGVSKSRTRLSDFIFTFHFHALEKEMATHSSVLAWRIPGKAEPGGLLSMGSHRVGHHWSDLAAAACIRLYKLWNEVLYSTLCPLHFVPKKVKLLCPVRLFVTSMTADCQVPPSMGFSRQEYWCWLPFPAPGDFPNPGMDPRSPTLQADSLPSQPKGPLIKSCWIVYRQ